MPDALVGFAVERGGIECSRGLKRRCRFKLADALQAICVDRIARAVEQQRCRKGVDRSATAVSAPRSRACWKVEIRFTSHAVAQAQIAVHIHGNRHRAKAAGEIPGLLDVAGPRSVSVQHNDVIHVLLDDVEATFAIERDAGWLDQLWRVRASAIECGPPATVRIEDVNESVCEVGDVGPEVFRYRDVPRLPCSGWERDLRRTIGCLWRRDFGFDGLDRDAGCRSLDLKRPEKFTKRQAGEREDLHTAISCIGHEEIVAF